MPYNTVVTFSAGNTLAAADLNNNFANLDYLNAKINAEIQISAGALSTTGGTSASPGEFTTSANVRTYTCMDYADGASELHAVFSIVLPSDYDGGTMTAKFHWTANSTSTNSVVWGISAVAIADDETLDVTSGTAQYVTDANKSTAYKLSITDSTPAFTISGTPSAGELVRFNVRRDPTNGSDTLAATARLLAVVLTYTRA